MGEPSLSNDAPEEIKAKVGGSAETGDTLASRLDELEASVEKLQAELEILKAQSRLVIQRTNVSFLDRFYFRAGLALVLPRSRTFGFRTDTGLGAYVGVGHYLGRNHVVDLGAEWDIYPSLSLRYRFELHGDSPALTWGPVLGVKVRALDARPWDNFLDRPEELKSSYAFFGAILGLPVGRSQLTIEFLYLYNQQALFFTNAGLQLFFL